MLQYYGTGLDSGLKIGRLNNSTYIRFYWHSNNVGELDLKEGQLFMAGDAAFESFMLNEDEVAYLREQMKEFSSAVFLGEVKVVIVEPEESTK